MATGGFLLASALGLVGTAKIAAVTLKNVKKSFNKKKAALNAPIAEAQTPEGEVQAPAAIEEVKEVQKSLDPIKNKRRRINLFETAGGVSGQELSPTQVSRRNTLLGN